MNDKIDFKLYASASLISLIGSGIQSTAIPIYVLDLTGSGSMMGILVFLSMIVSLAVMPFSGVLGDRLNRKRIMINMDMARGILTLMLALILQLGKMNITTLFIYAALLSAFTSIYTSSNSAIITELVENGELIKANSIMASVNSISSIAGPILGGLIYGVLGIKVVLMLNAISFIISAILEAYLRYTLKSSTRKLTSKGFVQDTLEGFKFITGTKSLLIISSFAMILNLFFIPIAAVFIPVVLRKVHNFLPEQYGLIQSFLTLGILSGNMLIMSGLSKIDLKTKIKTGLVVRALGTILLGITTIPFITSLLGKASIKAAIFLSCILLITGISSAFIDTPFQTMLQRMIPNALRSRVFSGINVMFKIVVPLGIVVYGFLTDRIPIYTLLLGISGISLMLTILFIIKAPAEIYQIN
jgi:MFS transporter, DHA3 family, macrolide efflux protein